MRPWGCTTNGAKYRCEIVCAEDERAARHARLEFATNEKGGSGRTRHGIAAPYSECRYQIHWDRGLGAQLLLEK
jgi:hypothetical protein